MLLTHLLTWGTILRLENKKIRSPDVKNLEKMTDISFDMPCVRQRDLPWQSWTRSAALRLTIHHVHTRRSGTLNFLKTIILLQNYTVFTKLTYEIKQSEWYNHAQTSMWWMPSPVKINQYLMPPWPKSKRIIFVPKRIDARNLVTLCPVMFKILC